MTRDELITAISLTTPNMRDLRLVRTLKEYLSETGHAVGDILEDVLRSNVEVVHASLLHALAERARPEDLGAVCKFIRSPFISGQLRYTTLVALNALLLNGAIPSMEEANAMLTMLLRSLEDRQASDHGVAIELLKTISEKCPLMVAASDRKKLLAKLQDVPDSVREAWQPELAALASAWNAYS